MAVNIVVPELGKDKTSATIGKWLKEENDTVSQGDLLVVLEATKATIEVEAPASGVLARIERKTGDDVGIGDVLGVIE